MPPLLPFHRITISGVAALFVISRLLVDLTSARVCSSPLTNTSSCSSSVSFLSYPFSSTPGCGHPSFQIRCVASHWIISINDFSFTIISHRPNSTSIFLSPISSRRSLCSSATSFNLPDRPIDLSNSPFRFSENLCSRLYVVRPCSHSNVPNCSLCRWECELIKTPVRLLKGCVSKHRENSEQGCKEDVFDYLENFLKFGFQIEWSEGRDTYFSNCKICEAENGVCGFNSSDPRKQFLCFRSQSYHNRKHNTNLIVLLSSLFVLACLLLVIAIATLIWRCRSGVKPWSNEEDPTTVFLHRHRSANLLPPVFTYEELESSTNRFDPTRKIGDGGFGSVFLAQLHDHRVVAVKRLHAPKPPAGAGAAAAKSFCNEILILSSIDHPNLVKLHGYCSDPRGLLLVYDYVPNGTLADHLHGSKSLHRKPSLTWQLRVEIALQTAMAIEYLHFSVEPAIVHRDITSSNIFIDKDMRIKLGDFGLSRLLIFSDSSNSSSSSSNLGFVCTGPQGTPGYLDPDYHRSFRLTEKSDVYSFGVLMFELISGMRAVDLRRDQRDVALADLVVSKIQVGLLHQVVDPCLIVEGEAVGTVDAVAELAFRCVAGDKDDRPDAREVVAELKRIRSRTCGGKSSNSSGQNPNAVGFF